MVPVLYERRPGSLHPGRPGRVGRPPPPQGRRRRLERPQADEAGQDDRGAADGEPDREERQEPADPRRPGDAQDAQRRHEVTLRGHDDVGQAVPELVGQDVGLARHADEVAERREDGHGDGGLAAPGRHEEVEQVLDDVDAHGAQPGRPALGSPRPGRG
ncbi:MAG: hypothetical protein MZV64_50225 [Ignavibacteriales bacterium]|nr:hypothetical protein [Ignavibacteriales bacterium]